MTTYTVTTQADIDAALAAGDCTLIVIAGDGRFDLTAADSSSPTIRTWDSSSPTIETGGSSSPTIETWGSSSPTIETGGSSHLGLFGVAPVTVTTHSRWASVTSSHRAATITGPGHVITVPDLEACDPATWLDYHGVTVEDDGTAVLFKAVHDDWCTGRGPRWRYQPGRSVAAEDFTPTRQCGQGLHLSPRPAAARRYLPTATRYVAVRVAAADLVPLGDKAKVAACVVLHEVDVHGRPIPTTAVVS